MMTTTQSVSNSGDEFKYERIRKIGIGSYGIVYKCIHKPTGQVVAIKRYSESDSDPLMRKIAIREVRMLRQLRHPNVINLIEVFRKRRRLHLVFDFCELTVLDVIEKYAENCPLKLIKRIVWQLVNAVNYCHLKNCIHRDIKPENILINQAGVVKLCDFGFARNMPNKVNGVTCQLTPTHRTSRLANGYSTPNKTNNSNNNIRSSTKSTASGNQKSSSVMSSQMELNNGMRRYSDQNQKPQQQFSNQQQQQQQQQLLMNSQLELNNQNDRDALTEYVATRWYRAPELLIGDSHYDTKIDIWAIGCVMAELCRGEPVWPGKTDLDQLMLIQRSLGHLTRKQIEVLSRQPIVDRLLSFHEPINKSDEISHKIPARVGRFGVDFAIACLQIDPDNRPNSRELLIHPFIHRARIEHFIIQVSDQQRNNVDWSPNGTENTSSSSSGIPRSENIRMIGRK